MYDIPNKLEIRKVCFSGYVMLICETLPGCLSVGNDEAIAIENFREAVAAYLESLRRHNEEILWSFSDLSGASDYDLPDSLAAKTLWFDYLRYGGWEIDHQTGRHLVLRLSKSPFRRLVIPIPDELPRDIMSAIIHQGGISPVEFSRMANSPKKPGYDIPRPGKRWEAEP